MSGMDVNHYIKLEQDQQYIAGMRPVINRKALFADMTADYLSPVEPNPYTEVTFRFRTAINNVDRVFLVTPQMKHLMTKVESDVYFDYYEFVMQLDDEKVTYHFEIQSGKLSIIYDRRGPVKDMNEYYHFVLIPGLKVPSWAKGAVMYQIFVERFYNGDTSNDVQTDEYFYVGDKTVKVDDWDKYPAQMGVREFYGGDLQGVLDKMDYIQDLGVDVIYFNPLFVSPSNPKYAR